MKILIADSGSTKTAWCMVDTDGGNTFFETPGMNPAVMSDEELGSVVSESFSMISFPPVDRIDFYGAGCMSEAICLRVGEILKRVSGCCQAEVSSDMLGAARALFGDMPGIACILGTGSNSCLYDGERIIDNIPPLGYILGDEGSGAVLGRTLVTRLFKRALPDDILDDFISAYSAGAPEVVARVYRKPGANRWLASLSPFILSHISRPEIRAMVIECFTAFIDNNIRRYAGCETYPIGFVGSIAACFDGLLSEAMAGAGLKTDRILRAPIAALADYYRRKYLVTSRM